MIETATFSSWTKPVTELLLIGFLGSSRLVANTVAVQPLLSVLEFAGVLAFATLRDQDTDEGGDDSSHEANNTGSQRLYE